MWSINVYSIVKKIKQNLKRYVVLNITFDIRKTHTL